LPRNPEFVVSRGFYGSWLVCWHDFERRRNFVGGDVFSGFLCRELRC
jgi:hypothetical protein